MVETNNDGQIAASGGNTSILSKIDSPEQLRKLQRGDLPQLCKEIREYIIQHLSSNPGHFASSMGAVEIAVALHYVFNTPQDHIVWDVGHQAYAHKILTGRRDAFANMRHLGGISGFPNPKESGYDSFMAGHASNSISAALGMAIADRLTPEHMDRKTVAVIGDASISGGLAFEGLNNASNNKNNLLIILNDNDMSIDDNVGALHRYLSALTTSERYNRWRFKAFNFLKRYGFISETKRGRMLRFNNSLKALISNQQNIFEGLNIRYFGPFDGHDVERLVKVLGDIKDMEGPRILHLRTRKGKGFAEAEKAPSIWHAPGKFNPVSGERMVSNDKDQPLLWQEVFGRTLVELADTDPDIVGITAGMLSGTSMIRMKKKYPERTFDVGISEGHAVTFAGGLASCGKKPFCTIYSSFLQRGYDNIIHDVAIQGLPVTFGIDRAGIVGEDGVTHHGLFDIAYLRVIPGMVLGSPMDEQTLRDMMFTSVGYNGPMAIRYPRGKAVSKDWQTPMKRIEIGKGRNIIKNENARIAVLSVGPVGNDVARVVASAKEDGVVADHYDMIWIKPLDTGLLTRIASDYSAILTVEDGALTGGFGSAVKEWLSENGCNIAVRNLGVPDKWMHHGSVTELRAIAGYDAGGIRSALDKLNQEVGVR